MKLICIPATKDHLIYVEFSLQKLKQNFQNIDILIVTPRTVDFEHLRCENIIIKGDSEFSDLSFAEVESKLNDNSRHMFKWYYQQILKYSILSKLTKYSDVLIIDADTIISKACIMDSMVINTTKLEYNLSYFVLITKLFPQIGLLRKSAIVNFMWFNKEIFDSMIKSIELGRNDRWYNIIMIEIGNSDLRFSFSEYETYANYKSSLINVESRQLKVFRRADLFKPYYDLERIVEIAHSWNYDVISFEDQHNNSLLKKLMVICIVLVIEARFLLVNRTRIK